MASFSFKRILFVFAILFFVVVPVVTALNVEVKYSDGQLPTVLNEGQKIDYSIIITGIPQQTAFIELETDLEPFNSTPLWNISDSSRFGVENNSSLLMQKNIRLTPSADITTPIIIKVSGKVPLVKQVTSYKGVVFTKVERTTGYLYYRVQPYDSKGYPVGVGDTKTFSISPGGKPGDDPQPDIEKIQDSEIKVITQDLYDKGLWQESTRIIRYSNNQPPKVLLLVFIASIVIVGLIAFVIGVRIGRSRAKKPTDSGELEMEEK